MEKSNYDNLPLSEKTEEGLSRTPDNIKWVKLLFDRQDEVNAEALKEAIKEQNKHTERLLADTFDNRDRLLAEALGEVIITQNKHMFKALEEQNKLIGQINDNLRQINIRLDSIEARLNDGDIKFALLEKYSSLPNTIIRMVITLIIGLGIGWILHSKL